MCHQSSSRGNPETRSCRKLGHSNPPPYGDSACRRTERKQLRALVYEDVIARLWYLAAFQAHALFTRRFRSMYRCLISYTASTYTDILYRIILTSELFGLHVVNKNMCTDSRQGTEFRSRQKRMSPLLLSRSDDPTSHVRTTASIPVNITKTTWSETANDCPREARLYNNPEHNEREWLNCWLTKHERSTHNKQLEEYVTYLPIS